MPAGPSKDWFWPKREMGAGDFAALRGSRFRSGGLTLSLNLGNEKGCQLNRAAAYRPFRVCPEEDATCKEPRFTRRRASYVIFFYAIGAKL